MNSKVAAICLGEGKVMAGVASLVITDKTDELPEEYIGFRKHMIAGAIVTDADFPINSNWNMMECEVIIIPKKLFTKFKECDGIRLELLLTGGYSQPTNWGKEIKL